MRTLRIAIILICAPVATWAHAHADCLVEEQIYKVKRASIQRAAELATQHQPILREMGQINDTAKDPTRPIGPQLSTKDLARFSELRQRSMAIELQQLLEAGYARDYEVIGNLFNLIQKLYTGAKEPQQGDPDYKLYEIIAAGRYVANTTDQLKGVVDQVSVPPKTEFEQCSLVAALHFVEDESLIKANQLPVKEATQKLLELRAKYPSKSGTTIDRQRMNPQDGATYDSIIRNTIAPANHEATFISDLEELKNVVRAADARFQANKKDAVDSGGDANAVGQTFGKMLDKRMMFGAVVLNAIEEAFPSAWVQQHEEMQKVMREMPGPQSPTGSLPSVELEALRAKLISLWNPPAATSTHPDRYVITIRIKLTRDHRLDGQPEVLSSGHGPLYDATRESAVRAVIEAQPYDMLSLSTYDMWKDITVNFNPRDVAPAQAAGGHARQKAGRTSPK